MPVLLRVSFRLFSSWFFLASLLGFGSFASAQQGVTPPSTLNLPHLDNQQGPTIGALSQSGRETINVGSGQLTAYFPVLDLPQHGGSMLHLGFVYSGNSWSVKETSVTYNQYGTANGSNPQTWWLETYATLQWVQNQTGPLGGPLHLKLPTLNADMMYVGYYSQDTALPNYYAIHCVTDWTFSDWQGATHTFNGLRDCDNAIDNAPNYFNTNVWLTQREAADGSGYQIDLTTPNDPRVIGPDGTVYHFPKYSPQPPNTNRSASVNTNVQINYYSNIFSSTVDPNGNTISYSPNTRTITDTVGRQINIDLAGALSWQTQASPGITPYTVSASLSQSNSGQTVAFDTNAVPSCRAKDPSTYNGSAAQAAGYHGPQITAPYSPTVYSSCTSMLNLPDGSNYELDFDSLSRLIKVRYPSGGYARYDYQELSSTTADEGDTMCNRPVVVVVAKHECSSFAGSCSQSAPATQTSCSAGNPSGGEATTCYFQGSGAVSVIDPDLTEIEYAFTSGPGGETYPGGTPGWAPHSFPPLETSHTTYSANSSIPLEKVETLYATPTNCPGLGEWCDAVAAGSKTTLYGSSGTATGVAEHDVTIQYPDNVLTSKNLDFSGNPIRSTTNTYETGGVYSAAGTSGSLYHLLDRVHSTQVTDSVKSLQKSSTNTHDSLGNLMQVDVAATNAATSTTKVQRNSQGEIVQLWDPMQFAGQHAGSTTLGYGVQAFGNCPQNTGPGLPTSSQNALNQTTYYSYYSFGKVACVKDPNGQITMYSYDPLGRVSEVDAPDAGRTSATYSPTAPLTMTVQTAQTAGQSGGITKETIADGLGRVSQQILTAPEGKICTETFYDGAGSVSATNDPRLGCLGSIAAGASITSAYDGLHRKTKQTNEDGTTVQWTYSGSTVTTTDEAAHPIQRTNDALGRLVQVRETDLQNTASIATTYIYDGFDNLWSAVQSGVSGETARSRSFSYDGMSRLLTAVNPETGTMCYGQGSGCTGGYDLNGNLNAKTDANGNTLSYQYDALNRITSRISSGYGGVDPISAGFAYDDPNTNGIGRLRSENSNGVANEVYAYDPVGRVTGTQFHDYERNYGNAEGLSPGMQVQYDLAGEAAQITYPDGRSVHQIWDAAGRLSSVTDLGTGEVYLSGGGGGATPSPVQYFPSGAIASSAFENGVTQSFLLNSRLQTCYANANSPLLANQSGLGNVLDREYHFGSPAGSRCSAEGSNNGNIYAIVDNLHPSFTQSLGYDNLNRLFTANVSDGAYSHVYNYDSFGNMSPQYSDTTMQFSVDTNNRMQINGNLLGYDSVGHLVSSPNPAGGSRSFLYNGDGYLRCEDGCQTASYLYDGIGQRSWAGRFGTGTSYVYLGGQVLAEWNDKNIWSDYIYANGQKIAKIDSTDAPVHLSGTECSNCGNPVALVELFTGAARAIKSGDKLSFSEYAAGSAMGGIILRFNDPNNPNGNFIQTSGLTAQDQDGQQINCDTVHGRWHQRTVDLSAYQGLVLRSTLLINDVCTSPGNFDLYFNDVAIAGNGTITNIYSPQMGATYSVQTNGASNLRAVSEPNTYATGKTTHYYLADHLGTTQVELAAGGWPLWQGRFTPFGMEVGVTQYALGPQLPSGDSNHYKFTGKERDAESGLDYFGARYYASSMGRFSSPDPSGLFFADPTLPQSLNLYSYARNNPLIGTDPTGMAYCQWDDGTHDDSANTGVEGAVNSGTECTNAGGSWSHDDGLNDDGSQMGTEGKASLTVTATLNTSTDETSVSTTGESYDPDNANLYLLAVGITEDTNHAFGCIAGAYGVGAPSAATGTAGSQVFNASQNLVGKTKAAGALGGSTAYTSEAAMAARSSALANIPSFGLKSPVGTPFAGNFAMRTSPNMGVAAGRYAPYIGAAGKAAGVAGTAYSSYKLWNCLGTHP